MPTRGSDAKIRKYSQNDEERYKAASALCEVHTRNMSHVWQAAASRGKAKTENNRKL